MLTSIALILLVGMSLASISQKLKLPRLVGMLFTGILCSPYLLDLLDPHILSISTELRQLALIIILLKAGLSINLSDLKKVGRPALLLSFLPATFEGLAYIIIAPLLLNITHLEAALMGTVLAAVSPAVVVPRMVHLIDHQYGTKKSIPQMILAGASCDDIYVILLFSTFLAILTGGHMNIRTFFDLPISIILGIGFGCLIGLGFTWLIKLQTKAQNTSHTLILLFGLSCALMAAEVILKPYVAFSGLLAVVSMAACLKINCSSQLIQSVSTRLSGLWCAAELMLFVLVGAAVDIRYTLAAGAKAIILILIALCFRAIGVFVCLIRTPLNYKERLFCILAYLPKATVQAAIGSIPLSMGLKSGNIILSVAVLGILITAPIGAFAIESSYQHLLEKDNVETTST